MYTLRELEISCQKPHWREQGSLLARRFARPAALYVTWLICRWPISANIMTGGALVVGWAAALLLALGGATYFSLGVATLWLWYLLDHVDGQLARLHGTQSVTGVYFDFMMHHLVHTAVAFSLGYGLAQQTHDIQWTLAGAGFAFGLMALSLSNDCRYKAFFAEELRKLKELKQLKELKEVNGSSPSSTASTSSTPSTLLRWAHSWALRSCEVPNMILALTAIAIACVAHPRTGQIVIEGYTLLMALLAPTLALLHLMKQVWTRQPDREFQARSSLYWHARYNPDANQPGEGREDHDESKETTNGADRRIRVSQS